MASKQELYLIRHLPTSMNKSGVYMGRSHDPDILITEVPNFTDRLDFLKKRIDLNNPSLYSSPALRCQRTMDIVKEHWHVTEIVKLEEDLLETDFGKIAGLTMEEIKLNYPDVYKSWIEDQSATHFPDGESYIDVQNRAWAAIQKIIAESSEASSIIVCTHVDVIKMILFKTLDIPISNKPLIVIPNGSVCTLVSVNNVTKVTGVFS